ncbi:MAG TPA: ABC transporter permease [Xanthobacteraceae bacterium]|jgi:simple sugar transport system permease protein|nr:ABC transporter permease [Xanthobacteraceae bacterium]
MQEAGDLGWWGVAIAVIGGAFRVSTPYIFVSLGEVITEKSGRVNLGLEGILVMGAMSAFAVAVMTGSPWLGVLAAGIAGALLGAVHAAISNLPRVNDIAVGIALFIFGIGLAFFLGKPFTPVAGPILPHISLGAWSAFPQVRNALEINALFILGLVVAGLVYWGLKNTRWGLMLRVCGDSSDAALAMGLNVNYVRTVATMVGGFLAGIGGSFLSLYYPGGWNEGLSSGQGLMAIALVIFARWNPIYCVYASLLFGAATALGPALQTAGINENYYLYGAAPYFLTLALLIYSSSPDRLLAGAPAEVSISK